MSVSLRRCAVSVETAQCLSPARIQRRHGVYRTARSRHQSCRRYTLPRLLPLAEPRILRRDANSKFEADLKECRSIWSRAVFTAYRVPMGLDTSRDRRPDTDRAVPGAHKDSRRERSEVERSPAVDGGGNSTSPLTFSLYKEPRTMSTFSSLRVSLTLLVRRCSLSSCLDNTSLPCLPAPDAMVQVLLYNLLVV